jgi:5-methylcytosine-specific restriction endonuclease McrA
MFISAATKREYLESTKWQQLRSTRLKIAQHKCESCGSTHQLQCHHITYQRLTNEHIDDLAILCGGSNGCHQRIHNLLGYDRTIEYPISILKDQLC